MPPAPSRLLLLLCLPFGLAGSAMAVEFGSLRTQSRTGEILVAEVEVRADAGERLVDGCIRVHRPPVRRLPVLRDATLVLTPSDASGQQASLRITTAAAVTEPAFVLGLEANCGAGRVWREFPILLASPAKAAIATAAPASSERSASSEAASGSDWIVAPGESPQSLAALLFPGQPGVQRRFIRALDVANPALDIAANADRVLEPGSTLHMPDWRSLGSGAPREAHRAPVVTRERLIVSTANDDAVQAPAARRPATRRIVVPELQLRLSPVLGQSPEATDKLRQTLRLEYRLLMALSDQLSASAMSPPSEPVPAPVAEAPAAPPQPSLPAASAPAESATPVVAPPLMPPAPVAAVAEPVESRPVSIPKAAPEPEPVHEGGSDWLPYAGGGAAFAVLLWLFLRRRNKVPPPVALEHAPTMVMEHSQAAAAPSAAAMEAFFAEPAVAPVRPPASVVMPPAPESTEVNPVMELAEIMLSFGRLQGAAQTLQEYIEANPREALQPWVKLLEIYRSGDMRAEFESLAQKLNSNFNVEVQHWDDLPQAVPAEDAPAKALSLEEMPHIREQLQALWGKPECLGYLHQLLHDNRGGQRTGFSLPVVQEILLLIDVLMTRETLA